MLSPFMTLHFQIDIFYILLQGIFRHFQKIFSFPWDSQFVSFRQNCHTDPEPHTTEYYMLITTNDLWIYEQLFQLISFKLRFSSPSTRKGSFYVRFSTRSVIQKSCGWLVLKENLHLTWPTKILFGDIVFPDVTRLKILWTFSSFLLRDIRLDFRSK